MFKSDSKLFLKTTTKILHVERLVLYVTFVMKTKTNKQKRKRKKKEEKKKKKKKKSKYMLVSLTSLSGGSSKHYN